MTIVLKSQLLSVQRLILRQIPIPELKSLKRQIHYLPKAGILQSEYDGFDAKTPFEVLPILSHFLCLKCHINTGKFIIFSIITIKLSNLMTMKFQGENQGQPDQVQRFQQSHCEKDHENNQAFNYRFYEQYERVMKQQRNIVSVTAKFIQMKSQIIKKVAELQNIAQKEFVDRFREDSWEEKGKARKTSSKVNRKFKCLVEGCLKRYSSKGNLRQHEKIKHPHFQVEKRQTGESGQGPQQIQIQSLSDMGLEL